MAWVVSPLTQPSDLGKHLQARGFTHAFRTTGMAADLLGVEAPTLPLASLVIERVRTRERLRQWLHPVAASFDLSPEVVAAFSELFARQGFGPHVPWQLFVGLSDGQPVATSRLFCAAGVAGVYHVATVPEARGRGFGTAMTVTAIHAAQELGYRIGVLAASSAGLGVYRHLGFQVCCHADIYVWPGEGAQAR
jgi:ribosomal protein S18 acetylase RimI-like enzyme